MTLRVVALKTLFKTSPRAGEVEALASGEGYLKNLQQALSQRPLHINKHPDSSHLALSGANSPSVQDGTSD